MPETWDVFLLGQHIPAGEDHPVIEEALWLSAKEGCTTERPKRTCEQGVVSGEDCLESEII